MGRLQHKAAVSPSHKAQCMPGWAPQFPSVPLLCRCQLSIAFSKFPVLAISLLLVAPVVIQKIQGRNKKMPEVKKLGKVLRSRGMAGEYWPLASWWQWPDLQGKCCYRHTPLILTGFVLHTHWAAALIICQPQKCVKTCVCIYVFIIHNGLFICSSSAIPYL